MGTNWLFRPRPRPGAALRLVCVPYAGGGAAAAYGAWAELLDDSVELVLAQLPGRERRFGEPARADMAAVAGPLAEAVAAHLRPPVALFGHSMGALVAFETARGLPEVERLLVSSSKAPALPFGDAPHRLDDAGLTAWVTRLGGAPADLLANQEMLALLLPTVRADLRLCFDYLGSTNSTVDCPVTAFGAVADPLAAPADVAAWAAHTTAGFDLVERPGGHFHLNHDPSPVIAAAHDTARRAVKEGAL
ncbi:thioesterase II family protein [Actinokineospora sp. 24-640]